jgi:hypothetical protein
MSVVYILVFSVNLVVVQPLQPVPHLALHLLLLQARPAELTQPPLLQATLLHMPLPLPLELLLQPRSLSNPE